MDNKLLYDRDVPTSINALSKEHRQVLEWVGRNKKVLETACHTGYLSAWLKRKGCKVTGVEIYGPALQKAMPFLERAILGDIEKKVVWNEIALEKYDVVLYMHILEHLVDPEEILLNTKRILNQNGSVVVCLPNISNWENRWKIIKGNFDYTDTGVMDKTHLRFYNYFTAIDMIERTGFKIDEYSGVSWKVCFQPFPNKRIVCRLNNIINRLIHKIASPNLTDKVTMFKLSLNNASMKEE